MQHFRGDVSTLYLIDKAGKRRAALSTLGDGTALILNDKDGKERVLLGTPGDDTTLILNDKEGKVRAALGNYDLGNRATGSTEHRAASSLVLLNERGRVLWEAP